ncbi:MAG TPA: ABC transporter ATP-binding protein [Ilumatobacteraceae bacterium]|nr:ABC transporter ATP-binding protein [Ilumatobacteraceae bacterium]
MKLELRGITKRFPGVVANDSVDLTVEEGQVVALLGENGAGKSTLMNILYGLYSADEGEILIDGEPLTLGSPSESIAAGIGMVHQHFMLVPVFTVAENVILGIEPTNRIGALKQRDAEESVRELSAQFGFDIDPHAIVENLPIGVQQRVEIIKVLLRNARFLVLDEPTAVLTPQEVDDLFVIIEQLRAAGKGIVFISHKLKEALHIADRIVVMRQGKTVAEVDPSATTEQDLATLMVGRPVDLVVHKEPAVPKDPVVQVEQLRVFDDRNQLAVDGVSMTIRAGEIVGIAGVQGNGQTELVEAITGLRTPLAGRILLKGEDVTTVSPRQMHKRNLAHVPEDRQRSGLVLGFTVTENVVLDSYYHEPFSRGIVMDWGVAHTEAERLVEQYDVRTPSVDTELKSLSGGNQQKVIVAREFSRDVDFVVASQPTRGVDVGSIEYIHARIVEERDRGAAVLIVSSELDEVMALSDRLLVMFDGHIVAELDPATVTNAEVGLHMLGSGAGSAAPAKEDTP